MQKIILIISFLLFATIAEGQETPLIIRVTDIRSDEGRILVAVFNSDKTFMDDDARFRELVILPKMGEVEETIMLPSGSYGLAVLHDLDGDEKMTTNFVGVPQEAYGYSNNPGKRLTDPPFKTCKFSIGDSSSTIEIDLVYW